MHYLHHLTLHVNRTWHSWQVIWYQSIKSLNIYCDGCLYVMCVSPLIPCPCYCIGHTVICIVSYIKVPSECYTLKQVFLYSSHANTKEKILEWISDDNRSDRENYSLYCKYILIDRVIIIQRRLKAKFFLEKLDEISGSLKYPLKLSTGDQDL